MLEIDAHIYEQLISDQDINTYQQEHLVLLTTDARKIIYPYFQNEP